jgi:hypothetical protein
MDGPLIPVTSNSKIRCSLENFTLDAESWLAALYKCVQTSYGDVSAHAAADCWLRVFEEQLEGSTDLPELTRITGVAITHFILTIEKSSAWSHVRPCANRPHQSIGGLF